MAMLDCVDFTYQEIVKPNYENYMDAYLDLDSLGILSVKDLIVFIVLKVEQSIHNFGED